jgi:cyclomaltodextrinase
MLCALMSINLCQAQFWKKKIELPGLASPMLIGPEYTTVPLEDYFLNHTQVAAISLGSDGKVGYNSKGEAVFAEESYPPIMNLNCESKSGKQFDIPVFTSDKKKYTFTYHTSNPHINTILVAGAFNGWNKNATELKYNPEIDAWTTTLYLSPGVYPYRIWENGTTELLDQGNTNRMSNGMGGENSFIEIPQSTIPYQEAMIQKHRFVNVLCTVNPEAVFAYVNNTRLPVQLQSEKDSITGAYVAKIQIPFKYRFFRRSTLRVYSRTSSMRFNDLLIPLYAGSPIKRTCWLNRKDRHSNVMYFAMVDRFKDGNTANNRPTPDNRILSKANNLGGDLKGITKQIRKGYFSKLGTNTLWISPITQNAEGAWGLWNRGGDTSMFSAYHGYWPTSLTKIDNRFGTEKEFKQLIRVAHRHGMNVYLDYVAHHVHQDHPLLKDHPNWTTPLYLPDGTMNTEKWDEHRLTTWFDTFLPTWDFEKPEVINALTDTAMFWVTNYKLDGFRHDATKHIRTEFWKTLTHKIKEENKNVFQIGETYGSPELIASYIGSGQLDAQFDFNLYDAAVEAFATEGAGFANLARVMNESAKYYGGHHLMGNITGNQDRARFISYADGSVQFNEDPKAAGWSREIQNKGQIGFDKLEQLTAFLMAVPGIPCIYYGDEIGLPGANDPDNRRMMQFENWNESQSQLHLHTKNLIQFRKENMALMYGEVIPLQQDKEALVFMRRYLDQTVICAFGKQGTVVNVNLQNYVFGNAVKRNPIPFMDNVDSFLVNMIGSGSNKDFVQLYIGPKGYTFVSMK